jgi:hypothetical protein
MERLAELSLINIGPPQSRVRQTSGRLSHPKFNINACGLENLSMGNTVFWTDRISTMRESRLTTPLQELQEGMERQEVTVYTHHKVCNIDHFVTIGNNPLTRINQCLENAAILIITLSFKAKANQKKCGLDRINFSLEYEFHSIPRLVKGDLF